MWVLLGVDLEFMTFWPWKVKVKVTRSSSRSQTKMAGIDSRHPLRPPKCHFSPWPWPFSSRSALKWHFKHISYFLVKLGRHVWVSLKHFGHIVMTIDCPLNITSVKCIINCDKWTENHQHVHQYITCHDHTCQMHNQLWLETIIDSPASLTHACDLEVKDQSNNMHKKEIVLHCMGYPMFIC